METNKAKDIFYRIVNAVIRILAVGAVFLLFLHSIFSTGFIGVVTGEDGLLREKALSIRDYPLLHLLVFLAFVGILIGVRRLHKRMVIRHPGYADFMLDYGKILRALYLIWFAAGCIWILVTQLAPGTDPAKVYTIAMQWREKDFSSFAEGGYLFRYPFQSGITLFYYLWSYVFGVGNYVGLQLINVAALAFIYYFLTKLMVWCFPEDRRMEPAVCICLMLWVPFFFYITYLYGIMVGMACSLGACFMTARYLDTRKYRYIVIAAIAIGVAKVLKSNCLIFAVAICCFLIYDIIVTNKKKDKLKSALFILLIIASIGGCQKAVDRYVEHLSGCEMPDGEVMVSWVVMGLQNAPFAPGSYSGYIGDVFTKYHYDTGKITEASIADIRKILQRMAEEPLDDGIPFFASKTAFQWNDPTFTGMYLNDNRTSAVIVPAFARSLINGNGRIVLSVMLNYVQTLVWIGALYCLFTRRKSKNLYELFGIVVFLGGYLFHLFWESGNSYTLPYFVMLIPYAVKGYLDMTRRADACIVRLQSKRAADEKPAGGKMTLKRGDIVCLTAGGVLVVFLAVFTRTDLFGRTFGLDDGIEAEDQFYGRNRAWSYVWREGVSSQYAILSPFLDQTKALTEQAGQIVTVERLEQPEQQEQPEQSEQQEQPEQQILIRTEDHKTAFHFLSTKKALAVSVKTPENPVSYLDDGMNMFYEYDPTMQLEWELRETEDGAYYILLGGQALTWQEGNVTMREFDGTDEQKWVIG